MKKRAASQKSDTGKKKEIARKAKTARGTSKKADEKKGRKIAPKAVEKTKAGKVKVQGEAKVKKVTRKEEQKSVREKISSKPKREKAKTKGKSEKKITKTEVSGTKKTGKVVASTRRMRKAEEKAPPKRRKKVPPKVSQRVRSAKALAPKIAEKIKVKVVPEVHAKEEISERIAGKEVVPSGVKEVVGGKAKAGTRAKPRKIVEGAGEGEAVAGTVVGEEGEAGEVEESREITGLQEAKVARKSGEKEAPLQKPRAVLPAEYGENSVTLITVDPYRLFAFWEVREETLEIFRGEVNIRVYDVTGIDFDIMDANSYLDIRADARVGKCYFSVTPEREYLADVGIIFDGIFIAVARSAKVSTPRAAVSEEGIFPYGIWETSLRTGY